MKDYLDTIHKSTEEIECNAHILSKLSNAFFIIGNKIMSEKLYHISESLLVSEKNIRDAVRREVHGQFEIAQESSTNLLRAMLAAKG